MLRPLVDWKPVVTLVPFSGIQFLDFAFDIEATRRITRRFLERRDHATRREDGMERLLFIPLGEDPEGDEALIGAMQPDDDQYDISKTKALEPFLGKWVPVPFLRLRPGRGAGGEDRFDTGPTNWARIFVAPRETTQGARRSTHHVVLAFDTELAARGGDGPYLTPSRKDAEDEQEFRLATRSDDMAWFLAWPDTEAFDGHDPQAWVDEWLRELFLEFKQAQRPNRPVRIEDLEHRHEHWARYLTFLELIEDAIKPPRIKLLDTVSSERRYTPIQVDLVLDIGNSRTCGLLIESYPDDPVDLNNSFVLQLRDLSRPGVVYDEPFETRIEFSQANFGKYHIARRSGRSRSFFWPSLVRVGPEAMRLVGDVVDTDSRTGMSSPKRYIWATDPVNQEWRFQECDYSAIGEDPPIAQAARRHLSERGETIRQVVAEEQAGMRRRTADSRHAALRSRFSRSSLYGFMLTEIFFQALAQINDPGLRAGRKQSDVPRRLRQIIITLPPATPLSEQRIMRSRAEGAIKLIWDLLGWVQNGGVPFGEPKVVIRWDEASCTQLVWLYTEITQKFSGQPRDFVRLLGRERPFCDRPDDPDGIATTPEPSLRVASIDVGGGTTDLMITTYYVVDNRALKPTQNFREGFKIAGDDVLEAVIAQIVMRGFEDHLQACGIAHARELLKELFGGDRANMLEQQKLLRQLFVIRVCMPIALRMLQALEGAPEGFELENEIEVRFQEVFGLDAEAAARTSASSLVGEQVAAYLEEPARAAGAEGFRLMDCTFRIDLARLDAVVRSVLRGVISLLAEAIHALDCDVVLLAGRPSRLPTIGNMLVETLAVPPDRIVSMHRYRTGIWYPFRGRDNVRIDDPKTTAVVGGMLCALAESQIQNFMLQSSRLMMRSTARYIGEMELSGEIKDEMLLFRDIDLEKRGGEPQTAQVKLFAPMHLGFRQLPLPRWMATPLYRLEAANPQAFGRMARPLTVTLERAEVDIDPESLVREEKHEQHEAAREEFHVAEVVDARGDQLKASDVVLRLQTLGRLDTYWLDSGIISMP